MTDEHSFGRSVVKPVTQLKHWSCVWQGSSFEEQLQSVEGDSHKSMLDRYLTTSGTLLDAGCGLGRWLWYFQQRQFVSYGVDFCSSALLTLKTAAHNAKVATADVRALPFPAGSFDYYLSFGVVEHFEEGPAVAVEEAYRVLNPKGIACIRVPVVNWLRRCYLSAAYLSKLLDQLVWLRNENCQFFEYHFCLGEFRECLEQAGFHVLEISPLHPSFGLGVDLPFLTRPEGQLSTLGRKVASLMWRVSPWSICHSAMFIVTKDASAQSSIDGA